MKAFNKILVLAILILYLLISCKKEKADDIKIPQYNYKNYIEILGKQLIYYNGVCVEVPSIKYELTHGLISKSYNKSTKKYYYGILLLSSKINLVETNNGSELLYTEAPPRNGIFINGLTSNVEQIISGTTNFQINSQAVDLTTYGSSFAKTELEDGSERYGYDIKSGSAVIKRNENNYEITLNGLLDAGVRDDLKISLYFKGNLEMRNTNSSMLSFENQGDYLNYFSDGYLSYPINECISDNHIGGMYSEHSIYLNSYSKIDKFSKGDYSSTPNNYKKTAFMSLVTTGVESYTMDVNLINNMTYGIGDKYLYRFCRLTTPYSITPFFGDGAFKVTFNDTIIQLDLKAKANNSMGIYSTLAHYQGKYTKIDYDFSK